MPRSFTLCQVRLLFYLSLIKRNGLQSASDSIPFRSKAGKEERQTEWERGSEWEWERLLNELQTLHCHVDADGLPLPLGYSSFLPTPWISVRVTFASDKQSNPGRSGDNDLHTALHCLLIESLFKKHLINQEKINLYYK